MNPRWIWPLCLGAAMVQAQAVSPAQDEPDLIEEARAHWRGERERIEKHHHILLQACWQKFAVNDCLLQVRRQQRDALAPVREAELALNARERAWRSQQRQMRLQEKADKADAAKPEASSP